MSKFIREPVWRIFIEELKNTNMSFKDEGVENSPKYVITPLGGKVNRVFIVGYVEDKTPAEKFNGYFINIKDVTGKLRIVASDKMPGILTAVKNMTSGDYVAILGRAKTKEYVSEDFNDKRTYTDIYTENIKVVNEDYKRKWVLDAYRSAKMRYEMMLEAFNTTKDSMEEVLQSQGYPQRWIEGVKIASGNYEMKDVHRFGDVLYNLINELADETLNNTVIKFLKEKKHTTDEELVNMLGENGAKRVVKNLLDVNFITVDGDTIRLNRG